MSSSEEMERATLNNATTQEFADALHTTPDADKVIHEHILKLQRVRSRLGLQPEAPTHSAHDVAITEHDLLLPRIRFVLREPLAEFFGVFVMILFGCGSVAQVLLSTGLKSAPGGDGWGQYQSISWG